MPDENSETSLLRRLARRAKRTVRQAAPPTFAAKPEATAEATRNDTLDALDAIYRRRFEVSQEWLSGHGLEIGAGANPQQLPAGAHATYFDKRDDAGLAAMFDASDASIPSVAPIEEIPTRFPNGADFLIAHQVLEHIADPIGALLEWSRLVVDGGVLVIGVPHRDYCPDRGRVVPTLEHILLDHLFERDATHFESREHAYSCMFGWMNDWPDWVDLDLRGASERAHLTAHVDEPDMHFHSFTTALFEQVWTTAARLSDRHWQPLALAAPDLPPPDQTLGEILRIFRVTDQPTGDEPCDPAVESEIETLHARLTAAVDRLADELDPK